MYVHLPFNYFKCFLVKYLKMFALKKVCMIKLKPSYKLNIWLRHLNHISYVYIFHFRNIVFTYLSCFFFEKGLYFYFFYQRKRALFIYRVLVSNYVCSKNSVPKFTSNEILTRSLSSRFWLILVTRFRKKKLVIW